MKLQKKEEKKAHFAHFPRPGENDPYVLSAINNIKDLINCLHQIVLSSRRFLELRRTFLLFLNFGLVSAIVSLFVNRKTADSNLVSVDSDSAYTSTGFDSNISHTGGHLIYSRRYSLLHLYSVQRNLQQKPFYNKTASILHITHMPYVEKFKISPPLSCG